MPYRKDIDGLRALAVVAVILFHAGFAPFQGGYVGVDVFFVISGFLITGILLREHAAGRFSPARFYERRVRRILPALLTVLAGTLVLASLVMFPEDLRSSSRSLVSVLLFSSNFLFWTGTDFADITKINYFGRKLDEEPLIHTWSLGIEEQFYLLFPIVVLLVWRFRRTALLPLMAVTTLASFALSEWCARVHPLAGFYLLPNRGWELLAGGMVAFSAPLPRSRRWLRESGAAAGAALVLISVAAYGKTTPFPGVYALAPVIGAALLLAYAEGTVAGRALSWRPLVGIGLISYSAYLWHQPLFALARYVRLDGELSTRAAVALCAATLALAFATWRWVETPFRDRNRLSTRTVYAAVGVATLLLLIPSIIVGFNPTAGLRARVASNTFGQSLQSLFGDCDVHVTSRDLGCLLNPASPARPGFVVIGDSHADALFPAFAAISRRSGRQGRLVAHDDCSPLLDVAPDVTGTADCLAGRARTLAFVRAGGVRSVFLVSRWSQTPPRTFAQRLAMTVDAYSALGAHVFIVEQIPEQPRFARRRYLRAVLLGTLLGRDPQPVVAGQTVTRTEHDATQGLATRTFAAYREDPRVTLVDLTPVLCSDVACVLGTSRAPYYIDKNHLNATGSVLVSEALEESALRAW